jgi:hypothetical protein
MYSAGGRGSAAFYGQKCLGNGNANFAGLKGHHSAIALDNAQLTGCGGCQGTAVSTCCLGWVARSDGGAALIGLCLHVLSEVPALGFIWVTVW